MRQAWREKGRGRKGGREGGREGGGIEGRERRARVGEKGRREWKERMEEGRKGERAGGW
jgi:hypothetical protein